MMNDVNKLAPIKKGLLELAVLQVIARKHAYAGEILSILNVSEFATQEGTLYPLLSKLRREKLVDYSWVESENGPPRKYYKLTNEGAHQLQTLKLYLDSLTTTLNSLGDA